ncbi:NADH-quinone oxidoreductase subunit J family protein [Microbacter margulisiae]|uniref:NADH-quinone oxidoreductase subunit J n=1 Tax=Microbacter margulisiae TaxID=1350067 RepID=A0A7W5DPB3_9PORP|nr:NADH-quinone oxidoreductase subunit J [Microbacter margulisiae]MBB3186300.1 NADH-quinone oxidoreductase subunit J [Microbacter margulisiae]
MLQVYLFIFLSIVAISSAMMVLITKNPVHSVLYLTLTFFALAGHYILLNAQFLAVVHVIVYAGAIMVLFLFTVMLLNLNKEGQFPKTNLIKIMAVIAGGLLFVVLIGSIKSSELTTLTNPTTSQIGLVKNLGKTLFTEYLLPFELSSVLFLSAMVGAVMLGNKHKK